MARTLVALVVVLAAAAAGPAPARAQVITYAAALSGPAESPANTSPGTGNALVDYNPTTHTMRVRATFQGLTGNTTASHIHAPTAQPFTSTAGVATTTPTFANFPLGVTNGSYDMVLDMTQASSYNPAFVTANNNSVFQSEAALVNAMTEGRAYLNIHTTTFAGGEIRGFLVQVPEPGTLALTGFAALAGWVKVRRRGAVKV